MLYYNGLLILASKQINYIRKAVRFKQAPPLQGLAMTCCWRNHPEIWDHRIQKSFSITSKSDHVRLLNSSSQQKYNIFIHAIYYRHDLPIGLFARRISGLLHRLQIFRIFVFPHNYRCSSILLFFNWASSAELLHTLSSFRS